jgi:hypothetical protein
MKNGIRKVKKIVDIFDKRILDSCKFISDSASEYGLVYSYLFLAAGREKGRRKREKERERERNPSFSVLLFSFFSK